MYKLLLSLFALTCMNLTAIAQQTVPSSTINVGKDNSISQWNEYASTPEVTVEYKFENCDPEMGYDQQKVIFRITNHTANKLEMNWHMLLYYNQECKTCDYPDEYGYKVVLAPNETKEGSCSVHDENFQLTIFSKFNDVKMKSNDLLTSFRLENITLTEHTTH